MTKLLWDQEGEKLYETGTKNGVLFVKNTDSTYAKGVAWNGLTAVSESPSGAEETALYADDVKYLSLRSKEEFGATIEAYTYPDEWAVCDGSAELGGSNTGVYVGQQTRRPFAFSYVTTVGNDNQGNDYGEKLHIIYNAMASPSQKSYATINDSPEAITFSWEVTTTPIPFPGDLKPSATITIDKTKCPADVYTAILNKLYGTSNSDPELPEPSWILELLGTSTSYTYSAVSTSSDGYATKNPSEEGWFEQTDDDPATYVRTTDTVVDINTTYYTRTVSA